MAKALCGKNKKIFFPALLVPFLRIDCQCVSCFLALSFRAFCGAGQPRAPVFFVALPSVRAGLPVGGRAGAFASSGEHRCAREGGKESLRGGTGVFPAGHACVPRPLSVAVQAGLSRTCADAWAAVKNEQDMLQKTEGIVLRTLKYGDASVIVHLYTRQAGRAAFVLAVPRSRRSSLRPAIFQPLAVVEVVADVRPVSDIYKVKEAKVMRPFASLPCHPVKAAIVLFLAEFLCHALQGEGENRPLYDYVVHSLLWLDECRGSFANFHLVFLMRLTRFLGLYPNVGGYRPGCYFDLQGACFTSSPPPEHSHFLGPEEASRLTTLLRMNYETMHLFSLSRRERGRCLALLNEYYSLHLPGFPPLKSLDVLHELFS